MKKALFFFLLSMFLIAVCFAQQYQYPFGYNHSDLNRLDDAFFDKLEKDLGRTLTFNNTSSEYTYIQHLKNKSVFFSLGRQRAELNEEEYSLQLQEMIAQFPTQTGGYYSLARFYMDKGEVEKAIDILRKAALEHNIPPFSHLAQLYAENDEFIRGYNELIEYSVSAKTSVYPDSNWIALYDSIRQQDQLYRRKYRLDDPRFEPQYQIDEQNALFLRELVREHGWVSKFLGRDYHFVHTPVMHFAIEHQLFFLDYIIADCMSYQAKWLEAEQVLWKMVNHTTKIVVEKESYHSLPLMCIDPLTGIIDLEQSMLAIRSAVLAMFGCGADMSDIWIISTSELSDTNYIESLNILKKYFALLGLDEDKIHIQTELLDKEIEDQLKLKTPVVLKIKL